MTIPSFTFLAFALLVVALFHLSKAWWWRQAVLIGANVYLIQSFADNWRQLLPYAGFIALGAVGIVMRRNIGRWTAWLLPILVLAAFVWLKRYLFVPEAILLPSGYLLIGLSYVFFRVMHLVIDGWETVPTGIRGLVSYFNYSLNFTCLVSGPIQRYEDYQESEAKTGRLTAAEVLAAIERIVLGFFKVYVVSAVLTSMHHGAIAAFGRAGMDESRIFWGAAVVGLYPIYLYFNFSGYTDFVIGVARLLHIGLPENFDRPFSSENFINFWGRWHISLSQWLKTYVYGPVTLGLMRRFPAPGAAPYLGVIAYFVTFFLVGFWHGQTSEFVFFGILQGGGVAANKLYQILMERRLGRPAYRQLAKAGWYRGLMRGLTVTWFALTLLWFWSNWAEIGSIARGLGAVGGLQAVCVLFLAFTVILAALQRMTDLTGSMRLWGQSLNESGYLRAALLLQMTVIITFTAIAMNAPPSAIVYTAF